MKYLIINDTHFGKKKDSQIFLNYQKKCLDNIILPLLETYDIKNIIHLGDVFDNRIKVNLNTTKFVFENIFDKLKNINIDIIVGNHDCYYENTNEVNSPNLLLSKNYNNINVFSEVHESENFIYVPWVNFNNREKTLKALKNSSAKYVFGHLQLNGFTMHKGCVCEHGDNPDIFHKFEMVMSGHFHTKSSRGNIQYLGSPWDIIKTDMEESKAIHVFDSETGELSFFQNPYKIFTKIYYNDLLSDDVDDMMKDVENNIEYYKDTFLSVLISNKSKPIIFEKFQERVFNLGAASVDFDLIDDINKVPLQSVDENLIDNTLDIIKKSIDEYSSLFSNDDVKKKKAETIITDLYFEALNQL